MCELLRDVVLEVLFYCNWYNREKSYARGVVALGSSRLEGSDCNFMS